MLNIDIAKTTIEIYIDGKDNQRDRYCGDCWHGIWEREKQRKIIAMWIVLGLGIRSPSLLHYTLKHILHMGRTGYIIIES